MPAHVVIQPHVTTNFGRRDYVTPLAANVGNVRCACQGKTYARVSDTTDDRYEHWPQVFCHFPIDRHHRQHLVAFHQHHTYPHFLFLASHSSGLRIHYPRRGRTILLNMAQVRFATSSVRIASLTLTDERQNFASVAPTMSTVLRSATQGLGRKPVALPAFLESVPMSALRATSFAQAPRSIPTVSSTISSG
jgi:hypothetical protein